MPATRGLLTAPLLALQLLAVALIVELIIGYFDRTQRPGWHFTLIGMSYGSLLAFPTSVPRIAVVLAINPFTARWLLRWLSRRQRSSSD